MTDFLPMTTAWIPGLVIGIVMVILGVCMIFMLTEPIFRLFGLALTTGGVSAFVGSMPTGTRI